MNIPLFNPSNQDTGSRLVSFRGLATRLSTASRDHSAATTAGKAGLGISGEMLSATMKAVEMLGEAPRLETLREKKHSNQPDPKHYRHKSSSNKCKLSCGRYSSRPTKLHMITVAFEIATSLKDKHATINKQSTRTL